MLFRSTHEDDNQVGSVGKPMSSAEIRLDQPDKNGVGEVLIRGPIVMPGYYRLASRFFPMKSRRITGARRS